MLLRAHRLATTNYNVLNERTAPITYLSLVAYIFQLFPTALPLTWFQTQPPISVQFYGCYRYLEYMCWVCPPIQSVNMPVLQTLLIEHSICIFSAFEQQRCHEATRIRLACLIIAACLPLPRMTILIFSPLMRVRPNFATCWRAPGLSIIWVSAPYLSWTSLSVE